MSLCKKFFCYSILAYFFSLFIANTSLSSSIDEYKLKSAYIYKIIKFVSWNEPSLRDSTNLNICVIGKDPIVNVLKDIQSKTVKGKSIEIIKTANIQSCHVVYITESKKTDMPFLIEQAIKYGALSISDIKGFASECGSIEFYFKDDKLRFKINIDSLAKSKLHVQTQLLELADIQKNCK